MGYREGTTGYFVHTLALKISDKIDEIAKEKGLWGLGAKTRIARYGNSLTVRIPKKIADFMHLREGKEAYIHPGDKNKIVIEA